MHFFLNIDILIKMCKRKLSDKELEELLYCDDDLEINYLDYESDSDIEESVLAGDGLGDPEDLEEDEIDSADGIGNWGIWKDKEPRFKEFSFTQDVGFHSPRNGNLNRELDFFQLFFTDELLQAIVDETNR